jgi:hypothetical protein
MRSQRPLRSWPTWLLRAWLLLPAARGLWSEVWIEIHYREVVEPALAAANDSDGPWLVAPPPGMH